MHISSRVRAFLLIGILSAAPAGASVIAYTDQASYVAAVAPQSSLNFAAYGTADYATSAGLTENGVQFVGGLSNIPGYYYLHTTFFNGDTLLVGGFSSFAPSSATDPYEYLGYTTITFPTAVTAVGFYGVMDDGNLGSDGYTVSFSDGDVYNGSQPWTPGSPLEFVGFVSSTPFTSLTLTPGTPASGDPTDTNTYYYTPQIETLSYGDATPKPGTWVLVAGALAVWGLKRGLLN